MWDGLSAKIGSILRRKNDPLKVGLEARIGNADLRILRAEHSVAPSDVRVAQDRLRMMEVEREILSHAIRRLFEAEADGKVSKRELESLVSNYKERMVQVRNTIQHEQSVVALYNLERIQDDLMGLLNKHFNDLDNKIGELKARLGIEPAPTRPSKERKEKRRKRRKRKKRSSTTEKSEPDERIKKIRAEVDKTLERLGRIEAKA